MTHDEKNDSIHTDWRQGMRLMRCTYLMILILLGLFSATSAGFSSELPTNAVEIENLTHAKPGEITLKVIRLLPADGVITAYEPILAEIETKNVSSRTVKIVTSPYLALRIEVQDSKGKLLGSSPSVDNILDRSFGVKDLTPGQSIRCFIVINAICPFDHPDTYRVSIEFTDGWELVPSKLAESTTTVKVLPFNAEKLKTRLEEIIRPVKTLDDWQLNADSIADFPTDARMKALFSVHHNIALPYLEEVRSGYSGYSYEWPALIAIRRVNTPESKSQFAQLMEQDGKAGQAAQKAAEGRLEISEEDYATWWK